MEEERWRILIIEWMNHQDQGVIKKGSEKSLIATARSVFKIDRSRSGVVNDIVNYREFEVLTVNGKLKIRILLDRYSVEVFFYDGEKTASCVIYMPLEEDGISFYADGSAIFFLPAFLSQTSAVVPMTSDVKGVPSFFSKCSCALFTYLKPMCRSGMLQ